MSSVTAFPPILSMTSVVSLLSTVVILLAAYALSVRALPAHTSLKIRVLFIWHAFDALIHFFFEGSYLYHCFFTYVSLPSPLHDGPYFLNEPLRAYGSAFGTSPTARLWQEYARADKRWDAADATVISLEILTVFGGGPLAVWICNCMKRQDWGTAWICMIILATAELYGGWITFCPEWLTGSTSLDTSNFMYLWVYLFFFNTLWVWIPLWIIYEGSNAIQSAFKAAGTSNGKIASKRS